MSDEQIAPDDPDSLPKAYPLAEGNREATATVVPKTSLRPPCALSVANQLCLASKGAQRGTKVFRVGAPPTRAWCRIERPTPSGLSVLPPDHLRVLPPDPRRVLPGGGVGVVPVHPPRVLPGGGVGVIPSDPKGVVPKSTTFRRRSSGRGTGSGEIGRAHV